VIGSLLSKSIDTNLKKLEKFELFTDMLLGDT
jgi:hypothetical protein